MLNLEKLKQTFRTALSLPADFHVEDLAYQKHAAWDSVGHMRLIAGVESEFDIILTTDEILDISNFNKACEIVSAHGIPLNA